MTSCVHHLHSAAPRRRQPLPPGAALAVSSGPPYGQGICPAGLVVAGGAGVPLLSLLLSCAAPHRSSGSIVGGGLAGSREAA